MPLTAVDSWDAEQREVLELDMSASGVVVGSPGVGKTAVILERARRLLTSESVSPDEIVVLTPSRLTATHLRDELGLRVAMATPGPLVRSVGSLAFHIVRSAMVASGADAPQLLTGADQDRIIAELLAGDEDDQATPRWPEDALPAAARASRVFRSELRAFMAECAQLGGDAEELAALADSQGNAVWAAIASFMADYRAVIASMRSAHRESAELIAEAATLVGVDVTEHQIGSVARLRVVMVDDAQELTRASVALLAALRNRGVAVLAFGDPDISSGSFRGATPELFAHLAAELGALHVLRTSHRQSDALVHVTRSVTQGIGASGRIEHRHAPGPRPDTDDGVTVRLADSPFAEADMIARALREWHVSHDVSWADMAVIAHDTRQVAMLETELAAREVPTRAAGVQRPLGQESAVRDILGVVSLAMQDPTLWDGELIASALLSPFGGLDAVGLRRLRARLRHRELADGGTRGAVALLAEAVSSPLELALIDTPEARVAERLSATLRAVHEAYVRGDTIHELLYAVWDQSRLFGRPLAAVWREQAAGSGASAAEAARALDALVALFDAAKRSVERAPEADAEVFVRELLTSDVPEDTLSSEQQTAAVTVMTPATALGAEFDAVVIAGVQDGVWPNVRLRGTLLDTFKLAESLEFFRRGGTGAVPLDLTDRRRSALHDELRLFVRACSRAKNRLLVTAVDDDDNGSSALFALLPDPSAPDPELEHPLTLRGLVAKNRRVLTSIDPASEAEREHAARELRLLAEHGVPGADPAQWFGVSPATSDAPLRDPQKHPVSVSPSRLDGLETCAVDWAIRVLGGNTSTWSTGLGTILHSAMEDVPSGDVGELTRIVESRWGELEFEAEWLAEKERRWAATLIDRVSAYLRNFAANGGVRVGAETDFEVVIPWNATDSDHMFARVAGQEIALPAAVLRGSIDRVERYASDQGELVPFDSSRPGEERVVIVDLKTGRSEKRVSDEKVVNDAQLSAYQMAVRAGALEGVDPHEGAGARLVVISQELVSKKMRYRIAHQPTLTHEQRNEFVQRVVSGAQTMAATTFTGNIDTHCNHERFAVCRIHTVGAVSAS